MSPSQMLVTASLISLATMVQAGEPIPVLTSGDNLSSYSGQQVILRGVVKNTRIAELLGVDVESEDPDLRGELAEAEGILEETVITEEDLQKKMDEIGIFANRGSGVFYRLVDEKTGQTVHVRPVKKQSTSSPDN